MLRLNNSNSSALNQRRPHPLRHKRHLAYPYPCGIEDRVRDGQSRFEVQSPELYRYLCNCQITPPNGPLVPIK